MYDCFSKISFIARSSFVLLLNSFFRYPWQACLNTNSCAVSLSDGGFGKDLCPGVTKTLAVEADCS
jgi:hypothetical protein